MPGAASVVLALGSNLGDSAAILRDAARELAEVPGLQLTGVSPLYESAAVKADGVDHDAPRYQNGILTAAYTGTPHELLAAANGIEARHGRVREGRWGDRTLDIDIIAFGELEFDDAALTIPHPRAAERDFVLVPWLQLDPEAVLPGRGRVDQLLAALGGDR
jgi:2-amino-4-hydroxy-6-hydroxymethyldihydropteridine diphosphokinase